MRCDVDNFFTLYSLFRLLDGHFLRGWRFFDTVHGPTDRSGMRRTKPSSGSELLGLFLVELFNLLRLVDGARPITLMIQLPSELCDR